jgi:glycerol-3-phosphate acyltransferase PlsX
MRIAIDAMGGDFSPGSPVEGAIQAIASHPGLEIILVGPEDVLHRHLEESPDVPEGLSIFHAPEVIASGERPLQAVRDKPNSSICKAVGLVSEKKADAMISAGNTGAVVTSASLMLKRLPGVKRPGIITFLPTVDGKVAVIDVGANIKCRPLHLFQYGVMGGVYVRGMIGMDNPRVGLLNIGHEDAKGNDLVRETLKLFNERDINFVGNIEGQDVFLGNIDVVVTDGFVGNTVLKVSEGLAVSISLSLVKGWGGLPERTASERAAVIDAINWLKETTDYDESGGAPLLGIDGICVICHGRSNPKAIANAIKMTVRFSEKRINENIVQELKAFS